MNEDIGAGPECYRLIKHWEKAPPAPWPQTSEGGALKAYQCSANKWTISFGVRWHPDGRPVREGDTITEDQVMPYLEAAMGRVVADVRRVVTLPINQYQMDALIVWVFNLGIGALKKSTELLPAINSGRWLDAAADMGVFIYATTTAKDGRLWKRAMKGLLIRRYTEATLALGYDPSAAYSYDISLPTEREWQPDWVNPDTGKVQGRYFDRVLATKTKFKDVLRVAQRYPLPESPEPAHAQVPVLVPTLERVEVAPAPLQDSAIPSLQATIDGIPTQLPLPGEFGEDELVLNRPAAPVAMDANGTASAPEATQPVPAQARVPQTDSNTGVSPPASAGRPDPIAPSPPVVLPSPLPPPKPPVIIAPKSVDVRSIPYGEVTPENGVKDMSGAQRVIGMVIVGVGSFIQVVTTRLGAGGVIGAIAYDLSRDSVVVALLATGVVVAIGWFTRKRGTKVITKGMISATQLLK